jgi:hypothetical protein
MSKQVVHYKGKPSFFTTGIGTRALVFPINHPDPTRVTNTRQVLTSPLIGEVKEDGSFETENSIYQRKDPE